MSTHSLLNSVKQMTGGRERPMLEITLAEALLALLNADHINIYKVQETLEEVQVWLSVTSGKQGTELFDDGLTTPEDIQSIDDFPLLKACFKTGLNQVEGNRTVFAIVEADSRCFGFIEVIGTAIDLRQIAASTALMTIFKNMRALLNYSEIDTLTGLLNRKTFDEYLARILASLSDGDEKRKAKLAVPKRRKAHPVAHDHWLGVIDIDHFKRVNDTFGHSIGDEVLLLIATMMKSAFRSHDRLFRFGGEEFVVLLKPTTAEHAQATFERFRKMVEMRDFPIVSHVTVSIGFARIGPDDQPTAIFDRADQALYWVKENGRNQACNHESLLSAGELQAKQDTTSVEFF